MRIGFICAISEESSHILREMKIHKVVERIKTRFYEGTYQQTDLVFVVSGMGKVGSALCTQILIDEFHVDLVLFSGIAGGVNPELEIGDTVIAAETFYHDVDHRREQLEYNTPESFFRNRFRPSGEMLAALRGGLADVTLTMPPVLESLRRQNRLRIIFGRVLTGDQVITSREKVRYLYDTFEGDCVEMEGAAVAHTCALHDRPFIIIRTISDLADEAAMEVVAKSMESVVWINFQILVHILRILSAGHFSVDAGQ